MSPFLVNLISAAAISLVITLMVTLKSPRAKAVVVVLPIPITIALLSSGGRATSLSIVGLALTNCFTWSVYRGYKRYRQIIIIDVAAAVLYVVVAYLLVKALNLSFTWAAGIYLLGWSLLMVKLKQLKLANHKQAVASTPLYLRSFIVFAIAFVLFSLKQYLAAFVVTFPYNSVFSVYENRQNLLVQAALFSRNSLALWAYFVANYVLTRNGAHWYAYVASWAAFGIVIVIVGRALPLNIHETV